MYATINPDIYKKKFKDVQETVKKTTLDTLREFKDFIVSKCIISIAIGLLLASQITILTKSVSQGLIDPIISKGLTVVTKDLNEVAIPVFSMNFKIGQIISDMINLLFVIVVVFMIWKLTNFVYTKYGSNI